VFAALSVPILEVLQFFLQIILNTIYMYIELNKQPDRNCLGLDVTIEGKTLTLINIYASDNDSPDFFNKVNDILIDFDNDT